MFYFDEVFLSIQGESTDTGLPCIFIRLFGCPIGCSYCDQPQDYKTQKHRASIETLVNKVKKFKGITRVCITGGEPLIYKEDLMPLVWELQYEGYSVSIETSGCLPIEDTNTRSWKYIMDVKCPSSGVSHKNIYENLVKLHFKDEVVFVIADRGDYEFMKSVLKKYPTLAKITLSPMFNKEGKNVIGKDLVDWMLEDKLNNYRIQIQLHKVLSVH